MDTHDHVAFLALGSNQGDRARVLAAAIHALAREANITLDPAQDVASLYESAPVGGPPNQPRFLNTAVRARTDLSASRLLEVLLRIEAQLGRVRGQRWGPRIVDIDLLFVDDMVLESQELTLPHPRMHERRFVLEPLAEIAPHVRHPGLGLTVLQLAQQARAEHEGGDVIRVAGPHWATETELVGA